MIAIIGILVALLRPAVQSTREAARRLQCRNHLKQLGTASIRHVQSRGHFPTGGWGWGWVGDADRGFGPGQPGGWIYNILPFIEQQNLYDLGRGVTDQSTKFAAHRDRTVIPLTMFNCPSRRKLGTLPYNSYQDGGTGGIPINYTKPDFVARSDYAANGGSWDTHPSRLGIWSPSCGNGDCGPRLGEVPTPQQLAAKSKQMADKGDDDPATGANGIVYALSEVKTAHVHDGMSNTYLVGEKYLNPDHYESGRDGGDNENMYIGDNGDITRWTYNPPMQDQAGFSTPVRFGSAHGSGFHVTFCDGSVRMINYSIQPDIHLWLGNRHDEQDIDPDSLQ